VQKLADSILSQKSRRYDSSVTENYHPTNGQTGASYIVFNVYCSVPLYNQRVTAVARMPAKNSKVLKIFNTNNISARLPGSKLRKSFKPDQIKDQQLS
jgi:hypothetical protein